MDYNGFKKAIKKSFVKSIIVGIGIFMFGAFIAWLILSGADSEMDDMGTGGLIVIWVLAGLCLFFGGAITFKQIKDALYLSQDKHPILNALKKGDRAYVIWVYEYVTQVNGGGSDHQVWVFSLDGKKHILSLKKKRIQEVIQYLTVQFPDATIGYSEEIKDQMSALLNKKL